MRIMRNLSNFHLTGRSIGLLRKKYPSSSSPHRQIVIKPRATYCYFHIVNGMMERAFICTSISSLVKFINYNKEFVTNASGLYEINISDNNQRQILLHFYCTEDGDNGTIYNDITCCHLLKGQIVLADPNGWSIGKRIIGRPQVCVNCRAVYDGCIYQCRFCNYRTSSKKIISLDHQDHQD
jgi:hypothetical protein